MNFFQLAHFTFVKARVVWHGSSCQSSRATALQGLYLLDQVLLINNQGGTKPATHLHSEAEIWLHCMYFTEYEYNTDIKAFKYK